VVRLGVVALASWLALCPPAAAQECIDPDTPDCDDDGFAPPDDCDDQDELVNPDADELCSNDIDDDCDGVTDDDCYERFQDGTLEGGSTCEGTAGGWAVVVLPVFVRRRRRS
jgi:hypothetical protein